MPCYVRKGIFLCGNLGSRCADCMDVGDNLCDYPVGLNKTCDRPICESHSNLIAPNMHYCDAHFKEWEAFVEIGGVEAKLVNVVPFK